MYTQTIHSKTSIHQPLSVSFKIRERQYRKKYLINGNEAIPNTCILSPISEDLSPISEDLSPFSVDLSPFSVDLSPIISVAN